jgi:hypothetical protein
MTLRAGSFDDTTPVWRGVIRHNSFPWYVCTHRDHPNQREATACARQALPTLKARDHKDPKAPLPEGWRIYVHD